ncbi:50S ribosomal protein L25 [bacterium]|nr:50S ribosomal protein L25 [bacterium]
MKKYSLSVKKRKNAGTAYSRRLRRDGYIPAVLYGLGTDVQHLMVHHKDFQDVMKQVAGEHALISIKVGARSKGEVLSIIKEIQHDPINESILHIDFEHISPDKPISVDVSIQYVGDPVGVEKGGVFSPHLWELPVKGTVDKLPDFLEINVSELDLETALHVKDISVQGCEILLDPDRTLASILAPRKIEEVIPSAEEEVEEEAAEEGAKDGEAGEGKEEAKEE